MFKCECCRYETGFKSNYTAHLKTAKHLKKIENCTNNAQIITNNAPIINNIYTCDYCNSKYTKLSSLNRHHKKCVKKIILHKDTKLQNNDIQIQLLQQTNDKLKETYESEIKELKIEIKDLTKTINKIKDKQLSVLQNNLKPSNNNNSQVIINNYPNAPNLGFPENIPVDQSLNQYIQLGGVKGLGKFISDHWAKDINPVDRSIWMVDPARNKFLIRCKDAWVIDIDGKQFEEINLEKIQKIFDEYLTKYKFDNYDYIKTMEFINDIKTKNMIIKGLKDAGKYLVYDKEKFTDFETIENETMPNSLSNSLHKQVTES